MNQLRNEKNINGFVLEIKNKYPLLFDRLCYEYNPSYNSGPVITKRVINLFDWNETREGRDFWCYVNDREFDRAKGMHPEYFEQENTVSFNYGSELVIKMLQSLDPVEQIKELRQIANALRDGWQKEKDEEYDKEQSARERCRILQDAIEDL